MDLSASSASEFVLIEYPGCIKNVNKALETLGGISTISQCHFAGRQLELRHTPNNPYTSALSSDKKVDTNITSGTLRLVLKVRRKKTNPTLMESKCLGLVSVVYNFDTMCDFQYLPLKKRQNADAYDDLIPRLIPLDIASALSWWDRADPTPGFTPLFLPPFQFSRYNTPSSKILCRETDFSADKSKRKVGHGQNLRTERKALSVTVHAVDPFPSEPSAEAVNDANIRCKSEEPHRMMKELFDERPMWTRVAIQHKTKLEDTLIKSLLQKYAFYIVSGPWGRLWCRFGYDPRTDPDAKKYQTVMVSFRLHKKIPERQRLKVSTDRTTSQEQVSVDYIYTPGRLPAVRQMWYSLCDIHITQATEILARDFSWSLDPPNKGWIPPEIVNELRELIKTDVRATSQVLDVYDDSLVDEEDD